MRELDSHTSHPFTVGFNQPERQSCQWNMERVAFFENILFIYSFVCMGVFVCLCMHVSVCVCLSMHTKRSLDALELEVRHL